MLCQIEYDYTVRLVTRVNDMTATRSMEICRSRQFVLRPLLPDSSRSSEDYGKSMEDGSTFIDRQVAHFLPGTFKRFIGLLAIVARYDVTSRPLLYQLVKRGLKKAARV